MSTPVTLRVPTQADDAEIVRVFAAQDLGWWGEIDGDDDDVRAELERAVSASGSLERAARAAVVGEVVVGVALHVGHGQTTMVVDPESPHAVSALDSLTAWLVASGATLVDSPAGDGDRLSILAAHGLEPLRSSFDLERSARLDDLEPTNWPPGIMPSPFRRGVDDQEVHDVVYSVWTDVAGHTDRPIDEWQRLFFGGTSFDPELIVLARRTAGDRNGAVAGVSICRVFSGDYGWVSQLAVGRPDRGVGLGRALLVESLHRLSACTGVERLGLSVEAQNDTALGLYRSVGLEVVREWVHCAPR